MRKQSNGENHNVSHHSSIVQQNRRMRQIVASVSVGLIIALLLFVVPLPYFIYKPGSADDIKPMVTVQRPASEDKGTFMLTTVYAENARIATYLLALIDPYKELGLKKAAFQQGESQTEYNNRQVYVMRSSQSNAIQAAYRHAGIPYRISGDGVMVLRFVEGLSAEKKLRSGDIITHVNGEAAESTSHLNQLLKGKKAGDIVKVTFKRGEETLNTEIELARLSGGQGEEERVGLGILNPADVQSVKPDNPEYEVQVHAGEIGGPSAGLMFTLEILNQLIPEDLTKGYRIAGTGTIDPEGKVGAIGGIQHKIIAAHKKKADFFFAPADYTEGGYRFDNYSVAAARAKEIGTSMKVIPVRTVDDALDYLAGLPPANQE